MSLRTRGFLVVLAVGCGPAVPVDGETSGSADSGSATTRGTATTLGSASDSNASQTVGEVASDTFADSIGDDVVDGGDWGGGFGDLGLPCNERNTLGSREAGLVWVPNSNQGTLSRIEHATLVETGRYLTRPDGAGAPGNVSVGRNGNVAVTNHEGGVTMIRAQLEDCSDPAGSSTGPDDIRAWPDGCVAWHTPFAYLEQRAIAWTGGDFNLLSCRYEDEKIWTTGVHDNGVDVVLIDGETGVIEQSVPVPIPGMIPGLASGAVDSQGNFWATPIGMGELVRVDRLTFDVETWPLPIDGFGLAVDPEDRVWVCFAEVARFDPQTAEWEVAPILGAGGGCTAGNDGLLWLAGDPVLTLDRELLTSVAAYDLPDSAAAISMDFDGYLWTTYLFAHEVYRLAPGSGIVDSVGGLEFPASEGDMTGAALALVNGQL